MAVGDLEDGGEVIGREDGAARVRRVVDDNCDRVLVNLEGVNRWNFQKFGPEFDTGYIGFCEYRGTRNKYSQNPITISTV